MVVMVMVTMQGRREKRVKTKVIVLKLMKV